MNKAVILLSFLSVFTTFSLFAQDTSEAFFIKKIYDTALTESEGYNWLHYLTKEIGGRLSGSPEAAAAVEYTKQLLDTLGCDSVWLMPVMVPHWVRGEKETVRISNSVLGSKELNAVALGGSVGTGENGIGAPVVEVSNFDDLNRIGADGVKGKIVFFNGAFDPTLINTFNAYGGAVGQRANGPSEAAKYGAVGVVIRSMASALNDVPHTGSLRYRDDLPKIPAFAISTNDAELLSKLIQSGEVELYLQSNCQQLEDKLSYNVIGELKGSEKPDDIILIGGHLDSWDVGEGAHDDGAGCVQALDILQLMKRLHYKPKRTIRCVLFMNEENGLRGGKEYANVSEKLGEKHFAAIESDRGGFTPRGFTVDGNSYQFLERFSSMQKWLPLLEPYDLHIKKGGSGADISTLKDQNTLLIGFEPDSQRYFDYHHTAADTFEAVNKRELELGTAAILSLVYLIDQQGFE